MAGEQHWSEEDKQAAITRIYHGEPIRSVADETGIPRETLRTWHKAAQHHEPPPYPGDLAPELMTDIVLKLAWRDITRIDTQSESKATTTQARKALKELGEIIKTYQGIRPRPSRPTEEPESPLAQLMNGAGAEPPQS
jgi:transposase-like protein